MGCDLCGESVENFICSYCGFVNAIKMGKETEQVAEEAKENKRKELLSNISEVGIVGWLFKGVKDEKPNLEKKVISLFASPSLNNGTITGTSKTVNVNNGKDITFYMKTNQKKEVVLIDEKLNIPNSYDTFDISVKINERLKLDVFYHIKDGKPDGTKVLENVKLGKTLVQSAKKE